MLSVPSHPPGGRGQGSHKRQEQVHLDLAVLHGQGEDGQEGDLHNQQAGPARVILRVGGQKVTWLDTRKFVKALVWRFLISNN